MILRKFKLTHIAVGLSLAVSVGCATQENSSSSTSTSPYSAQELQTRYDDLATREAAIAKREAELSDAELRSNNGAAVTVAQSSANMSLNTTRNDLLPPGGKSGECYARVWVEPTYKTVTDNVLSKEASTRVEIIPAVYETVQETVLVSAESFRLETTPASYETITEEKLVSEGGLNWKVDLTANAAPASKQLLDTASSYGINLSAASPGECFHEHFVAAKFEEVEERVLSKEAYDVVQIKDAEYRWVEKQVLVSEASSRLEEIPAVYDTVTEEVIDVPAHTVWKKGTGPIQKLDAATGEIMCLVDIPATYKTVSRTVLVSPATTREIEIPAVYDTIKVRELVSNAKEVRTTVPAEYNEVTVTQKVAEPTFVWHEVHDATMHKNTRTGNKICLTEDKPRYETVTRTVVKTPASTSEVAIPAEYKEISVQKLVSAAQEKVIDIPAEYATVSRQEVKKAGFMEWRSILCETNINLQTVSDIQQALTDRGYQPGPIDGVIGQQTIKAVNAFQADNSLPIDKYLNIETIEALRVSI